jgi:hypothetical protein
VDAASAKALPVASVEPSSATRISAAMPREMKYSAHAARLAGSRRASLYAGRIRERIGL